ncbi:MAG: MlaE family lipid ABC transporter permease subunit [Pseudomonadota bacterium]
MEVTGDLPAFRYEMSGGYEETVLHLHGAMDASTSGSMIRQIVPLVRNQRPTILKVDLEKVSYVDDFGVLVLVELRRAVAQWQGRLYLRNVSREVRETISALNLDSLAEAGPSFVRKHHPGIFLRLGEATLAHASDLKYLVAFIGSVLVSLLYVCFHPKALRTDDTIVCMQKTGVDALPIVGLISFLMGLIMAFMSAVQLEQFGANIYVASLVSLTMVRELGPIMTAIIVAGRSGSAFAAEIGTMKISEEVDALFTMGFDPTRFLVVPKVIASVIMVPILTLFSDLFAIAGGLVVGVFMLDLTASAYIGQTIKTLKLFDVFWGFFKSGVFGLLIAWIGCLKGFQVRGGAASVGAGTTSAVVSSIFLIILSDSVFAVVLRYWD